MRRIRSKNMAPELTVRSLAHRMGYRYSLHNKNLPGKPDLVFSRKNKVVFVHGCFWHQHTKRSCKIVRIPKSNKKYWLKKLKRNQIRDAQNKRKLWQRGWKILTIWECETKNESMLQERILKFLGK